MFKNIKGNIIGIIVEIGCAGLIIAIGLGICIIFGVWRL